MKALDPFTLGWCEFSLRILLILFVLLVLLFLLLVIVKLLITLWDAACWLRRVLGRLRGEPARPSGWIAQTESVPRAGAGEPTERLRWTAKA